VVVVVLLLLPEGLLSLGDPSVAYCDDAP